MLSNKKIFLKVIKEETVTETFLFISYSPLQEDLYVFPEATGIIVPYGFGISKRFQQRSCLEYLPGIQTHRKSTTFVKHATAYIFKKL